jgi:DNA replication protein DnaC
MELFARLLSVKFIRAEELVEKIRNNNSPNFLKEISRTDVYAFDLVPDRYYDLIIDDLGFESEKSNTYGNVRDIMEQVLKERSNIFPKWKTHFTTNLTEPQILARYGDRIYSRLCEMCHFVTMTNGDRRREGK